MKVYLSSYGIGWNPGGRAVSVKKNKRYFINIIFGCIVDDFMSGQMIWWMIERLIVYF